MSVMTDNTTVNTTSQEVASQEPNEQRVHGWLWWSMVVIGLALLGTWLHLGWIAPDRWPLRWLEITSVQQRISDDQIRARLTDSISGGFFSLNLSRMRNQLLEMNWVADVNLQRRWPDTLKIAIREHQPVAHWGNTHLLSDRREVFSSENQMQIQGLPLLAGADARRDDVIDQWLQWREYSASKGLRITRLELQDRGSWEFEFNDSITLRVGRDQIEKRIRRFLDVWPKLDAQLPRPVVLDMRYSNGLALHLPDALNGVEAELALTHTATQSQRQNQ